MGWGWCWVRVGLGVGVRVRVGVRVGIGVRVRITLITTTSTTSRVGVIPNKNNVCIHWGPVPGSKKHLRAISELAGAEAAGAKILIVLRTPSLLISL